MNLQVTSLNSNVQQSSRALCFSGKLPVNVQKYCGVLDGFNPKMERVANEAADVFETVAKKEKLDLDKLNGYELRFIPQNKRTDFMNMYLCRKEATNESVKKMPHIATSLLNFKKLAGTNWKQEFSDGMTSFVNRVKDEV